jgi:predicted RNA-binding protein (virulence factor B family)
MIEIGKFHELTVVAEAAAGVYLDAGDGEEILLPRKYVPAGTVPGGTLRVFVLRDSEDRLLATTQVPKAVAGEYACLRAKEVTEHGAFLDWGLDKDLFVPFKEQKHRMMTGQSYVVRVCVDAKTDRIIGSSRLERHLSHETGPLTEGQKVELMVYDFTDLGILCVVDRNYYGMLYRGETFELLDIGAVRTGYIKKVREDGKLDVTLQPQGYDAALEAMPAVLETLRRAGGVLPYNAKTDADEIARVFRMSKKLFKKAIGGLYKDRKIVITDTGIRLP